MAQSSGSGRRVIVIGAGISGLAAARALAAENYEVVILEARDRIGGRILSDYTMPGVTLDLGAGWIHGSDDNPLAELVRDLGLEHWPTNYDNTWLWSTSGERLSAEQHDDVDGRFVQMLDDLDHEREALDEAGEDDIALGDAVEDWVDGQSPDADAVRELAYSISTTIEYEYAADIADLSFYYFDGGDSFDGDDLLLAGGMGQLVHELADELDVRLGHIVERVNWDRAGVRVTTNQGEFDADRCVVTLPQGVLKAGYVTFDPALPEPKLAAIERLRSGTFNKLVLRFDAIFWPLEPELLGFIPEQKGAWAEWLNLAHYTQQPVLVGFSAADYARQLEELADADIIADAMQALRAMFGADVPDPVDARVTRWGADRFAHGAFSYVAFGADPDNYDQLAEPVGERLFFAGEATSFDFPATMHGAFLSGLRAAEEIFDIR